MAEIKQKIIYKGPLKYWHIISSSSEVHFKKKVTHEEAWVTANRIYDSLKETITVHMFHKDDDYKKFVQKG